jgi:hypothetical protein
MRLAIAISRSDLLCAMSHAGISQSRIEKGSGRLRTVIEVR